MPLPVYLCKTCGNQQVVVPDGRGFPPDIAKRKLVRRCKDDGHKADPQYRAGYSFPAPPPF